MSTTDKATAVKDVHYWLIEFGRTDTEATALIERYQKPLEQWLSEYLQTGSHLTPQDFADEIQQAEIMKKLVHA